MQRAVVKSNQMSDEMLGMSDEAQNNFAYSVKSGLSTMQIMKNCLSIASITQSLVIDDRIITEGRP